MTRIEGLPVTVEHVAFEVARLRFGRMVVDQVGPLASPQSSELAVDAIANVIRPGQTLADDVGFKATVLRRAAEVLPVGDPNDFSERQSRNEKFAAFIRDHQILTEYDVFPPLGGAITQPLKYRRRLIKEAVAGTAANNLGVASKRGEKLEWRMAAKAAAQYYEADARKGSTLLIARSSEPIREMSKEWLRMIQPKVRHVGGQAVTDYSEIGERDPTEKIKLGRRRQVMYPVDHFWRRFKLDIDDMNRLMRIRLRGGY